MKTEAQRVADRVLDRYRKKSGYFGTGEYLAATIARALERYARKRVEEEREACAEIADNPLAAGCLEWCSPQSAGEHVAAAIRARGRKG